MSMNLRVGVGAITFNGPQRVSKVLESLKSCPPHQEAIKLLFEGQPDSQLIRSGTIVIDDGSTHKNVQLLRKICEAHSVPLGEHRNNQGISASWNHCITDLVHQGNADIVILLNDDVLLTPGWLESIVFFLYHNPTCALAGLHAPYDGELLVTDDGKKKGEADGIHFDVPHRGLCANGFCFGLWVHDWNDAPKFDEAYHAFYEEVDLGIRLAAQGKLSYNLPWPLIQHEWGTTFYENPSLDASIKMNLSRERFVSKWGGDIAHVYKQFVREDNRKPLTYLLPNAAGSVKSFRGLPEDVVR